MARILSCYGMGCAYENSRGDCTWKGGPVYPCQLEEMDEDERRRTEYLMERDYDMEDDDE